MPRPLNPLERRSVRVTLPLDLLTRFELSLTSPTDGGRPQGIYADFFTRALREHFEHQILDVGAWCGQPPGRCVVRGDAQTINLLKQLITLKELS